MWNNVTIVKYKKLVVNYSRRFDCVKIWGGGYSRFRRPSIAPAGVLVENAVLSDLFLALSKAFGDALERFDDALFEEREKSWRVKDKRSRCLLTEFGDVSFTRRVYVDECGDRRALLDEVMAIRTHKRLSPGAFEALAYFGAEIPYHRAAKTVFRRCTTKVSSMTTLATLREVGDLLESKAVASAFELFKRGVIPSAEQKAHEICVEDDGVWIPLQNESKKAVEIKTLCAYKGKHAGQRIGCVHHAAIAKPQRFFEEAIARIGTRFALEKIQHIWFSSDGGGWEKQLKEYLPAHISVTHKLDPWHLNRAIKVACPDKDEQRPLFEMLYQGNIDGVLEQLRLRIQTGMEMLQSYKHS